ncbi:sushi, von Willebrand factor type A, EGF and pentraxin domain-containing protein 1-like isoform X2 [Leptopilina heterotoma]|uniref:sushi, von Willebrand factor type A, EGF and pentraxin domain-containing protein 1-like isoform X2 n=1 Tax=Leptopilina heterotoma TaxID=63436 RepID=UPI001CA8CFA8|nr:sushi, von Willebrand factor type A, EGF and pentraxin domain-containing protein 1-like isoform X2 [Leptopilina heterotoma]
MILQVEKNLFFIFLILFLQKIESKSVGRATPKIENGFVEIHDNGQRYSFDCKEGYQLIGEREIYYENNEWSNKIPICHRIKAQIDFPFGHYLVSEEGRKYTFFCNDGYHLKGQKKIKFENNKWGGSVPKCVENEDEENNKKVDDEDDDDNDEIFESNENDPKIQIVMKDNYDDNSNKKQKEDDREISESNKNDPKIVIVMKDNNDNNKKQNEDDDSDNDDDDDDDDEEEEEDDDDDNDDNEGKKKSKVTIGGIHFQIEQTKEDKNCLNMEKITLLNGFVRKMENKCKWIFHCNEGFTLFGNREIEFLNNKQWTSLKPICIPTHNLEIENGNFAIKMNSGNSVLHYQCENGYELVGDNDIITSGQIINLKKPSCRASCPLIPLCFGLIGINLQTNFVHFICEEGYQLKGNSTAVCANGKWSNPPPVCIPNCPKIDLVNGDVEIKENIATFRCNENYNLLGNNISICHEGEWIDEIPICAPKCPTVKLTQAHKIMALNLQSTYYKFSCKEGYTMRGNSEIFCRYGQWSHPVPICEVKRHYYQITDGFKINNVISKCPVSNSKGEY